MKRKVVSIVLSGLLILTSGSVVNANKANPGDKIGLSKINNLNETKQISEIKEDNKTKVKDEEITNRNKLTKAYIEELKKGYDIELKDISSNKMLHNMIKEKTVDNTVENFKISEMIIQNKNPYKTIYFDDGTKEEYYTKTMLVLSPAIVSGSKSEYQNDLNIHLYARMNYSKYIMSNGNIQVKLINGEGRVIELIENGMRNFEITNTTYGSYENPDGSRGFTLNPYASTTRNIPSPQIGISYLNNDSSPHYYSVDIPTTIVRVTLTIEWRHGTRYYTSRQDLYF